MEHLRAKSRVISIRLPEERYIRLRRFLDEEGGHNLSELARALLYRAIDELDRTAEESVEDNLTRLNHQFEDLRHKLNKLAEKNRQCR